MGNAVREIGNGKSEVSKSLLASRLGISEQAGDFTTKIVSSKCYGIIEGKTSFSLTPLAKTYFFPTKNPENERKQALIQFFSSPGSFSRLIELYDGTKPSLEIMGNMLHQEMGIPDSWKSRVAKFFMRSAEHAGAIDPNGFLRVKAQLETLSATVAGPPESLSHHANSTVHHERSDASSQPAHQKTPHGHHPEIASANSPSGIVVWTYPCEGRTLRIETPENITPEVWQKLSRYLDVIKP